MLEVRALIGARRIAGGQTQVIAKVRPRHIHSETPPGTDDARQYDLSPAGFKLMSASPARDAGTPHANDSNEEDAMFDKLSANRRDLLIAPLLAAIPTALLGDRANASPVDPNKTFTKLPDQITWEAPRNRPPRSE